MPKPVGASGLCQSLNIGFPYFCIHRGNERKGKKKKKKEFLLCKCNQFWGPKMHSDFTREQGKACAAKNVFDSSVIS